MNTRLLALSLALMFLTGCASILEREYSTVEPHSSKFWESEAADTLRAENYQDLVNDLLNGEINLVKFHGDSFLACGGTVYSDFCSDRKPSPAYGPDAWTLR